jgi:hypothetical protein
VVSETRRNWVYGGSTSLDPRGIDEGANVRQIALAPSERVLFDNGVDGHDSKVIFLTPDFARENQVEKSKEASPGFEPGDNGFANRSQASSNTKKISTSEVFSSLGAATGAAAPLDSDLAGIVDLWPSLPKHIRRAVLALVGAAEIPH